MLELNFETFPELRTERLILRQVQFDDVESLHRMRTDPKVMEYMDTGIPKTMADSKQKIEKELDSFYKGESVYWVLALKETTEMIGGAGFWRIIKEHHRAEIGYQLLPEYWRKGYSLEALKNIIQFGFNKMGLHSIEANVNPKNIPSIKLLEKIGFDQEAYFKENFYFEGKFLDSVIYSLLINNWKY